MAIFESRRPSSFPHLLFRKFLIFKAMLIFLPQRFRGVNPAPRLRILMFGRLHLSSFSIELTTITARRR